MKQKKNLKFYFEKIHLKISKQYRRLILQKFELIDNMQSPYLQKKKFFVFVRIFFFDMLNDKSIK